MIKLGIGIILLLLLLVLLSAQRADAAASRIKSSSADEIKAAAEAVVDWLVQVKGCYISPKLSIESLWTGAPVLGVFATNGDVQEGEILIRMPHSAYVGNGKRAVEKDEKTKEWYRNYLQLAKFVMGEMDKGPKSEYLPYLTYIATQSRGQTPATWSKSGKDLLRQMLPPNDLMNDPRADTVDWMEWNFEESDIESENARHWIATCVQRGYDSVLVPFWDMVNHDNGKINTVTNSLFDESGIFEVKASEFIPKGDEIFHTYDMCADCHEIADEWGTMEILRDFGFVEDNPQRWIFWQDTDDFDDVYFEIHTIDNEKESKKVVWDLDYAHPDPPYGIPSPEKGIPFLRAYRDHLSKIELEILSSLPHGEHYTLSKLYKGLTTGLTLAIEAAAQAHNKNGNASKKGDEL